MKTRNKSASGMPCAALAARAPKRPRPGNTGAQIANHHRRRSMWNMHSP
jgi:hypothetical protein